jgi:hypothetical protein
MADGQGPMAEGQNEEGSSPSLSPQPSSLGQSVSQNTYKVFQRVQHTRTNKFGRIEILHTDTALFVADFGKSHWVKLRDLRAVQ